MKNLNKIWITGSNGMVGKAIIKNLASKKKYTILKTTRKDFDQTNQMETAKWIKKK